MQHFEDQVGGHQNIKLDSEGSILFKPCIITEKQFYEGSLNYPELLPYIPNFMGLLHPKQDIEKDKINEVNTVELIKEEVTIAEGTYICLENLLEGYTKPNVLDLKIGTKLYDHLATQEKRDRMVKRAAETTSLELGLRVTGMKVYDTTLNQYKVFDREYGVKLTKETMYNAFLDYFPKELDIDLKKYLLNAFINEIEELRSILKSLPIEMAASSLLFVYEGEPNLLRQKIEEYNTKLNEEKDKDEEDEEDEEEERLPFTLRLIDFAHSFWMDKGHQLDEGCFLGIDNTLEYLERMLESDDN